jgi:hypothetical protein
MPIKNYTTEVPATRSIDEIMRKLVAHGARKVLTEYTGSGEPEQLSFIIPGPQGDLPFRLPANIPKIEKLLWDARKIKPETWHHDYAKTMERVHTQAVRVAWRILKDWVDAQLAIIDTEMVTLDQVFLPYMTVRDGKHTLYEVLKNRGFLQITMGDQQGS